MLQLQTQIEAAAQHIQNQWKVRPKVGIILGSGLGNFAQHISTEVAINYRDIPGFPESTVVGHGGQLLCGDVGMTPVVTMKGRFHHYEGYSYQDVTLPVRVMKQLGVDYLIVSNASGGLNPHYRSGDIMILEDHINFTFGNPLIGINDDRLGPRFPDLCRAYDPHLIELAVSVALQHGFTAHKGVYAAVTGPTYETRAESRMLRELGADVAGMSTVPETIVAVHAGIPVLALSAVTNLCRPDLRVKGDGHQEVVDAATLAEPKMTAIVLGVLKQLESRAA